MANTYVGVQDHPTPDHEIENEDKGTFAGKPIARQVVAAYGPGDTLLADVDTLVAMYIAIVSELATGQIYTQLTALNGLEGLTSDAKVVGDTAGTISAKLRGINTELASLLANDGTTADAKVVGDVAGTIAAKLRGINTALAGTLATDSVKATASAPNVIALTAGSQTVLAASSRKSFSLQNVGIIPIPINFITTTVTATSYHMVLAAGAALHDGKGGFYSDSQYQGIIKAFGVTGALLAVTEF